MTEPQAGDVAIFYKDKKGKEIIHSGKVKSVSPKPIFSPVIGGFGIWSFEVSVEIEAEAGTSTNTHKNEVNEEKKKFKAEQHKYYRKDNNEN